MGLPGGERSLTISSALWIQYTNVTDKWMDRQRDGWTPGKSQDCAYAQHLMVQMLWGNYVILCICPVATKGRPILARPEHKQTWHMAHKEALQSPDQRKQQRPPLLPMPSTVTAHTSADSGSTTAAGGSGCAWGSAGKLVCTKAVGDNVAGYIINAPDGL